MDFQKLMDLISSKPIKIKEVINSIEKLKTQNSDLFDFISNTDINISEFEVTSELMNIATKMIEKRVSLNIVKNIYDQYSIIFTKMIEKRVSLNIVKNIYDQYSIIFLINILMTKNKSAKNKLEKIYFDVITNSDKFDIHIKVNKNLKKISDDNITLELFWLIPLFINLPVLINLDYNKFIKEMKTINNNNSDFKEGYSLFVTVPNFDKNEYKNYLTEGKLSL